MVPLFVSRGLSSQARTTHNYWPCAPTKVQCIHMRKECGILPARLPGRGRSAGRRCACSRPQCLAPSDIAASRHGNHSGLQKWHNAGLVTRDRRAKTGERTPLLAQKCPHPACALRVQSAFAVCWLVLKGDCSEARLLGTGSLGPWYDRTSANCW